MKTVNVALGWRPSDDELSTVRRGLPSSCEIASLPAAEGTARYAPSAGELAAICADADALITWVLPAELLAAAPRLRLVSWMHHGVDRLPLGLLGERGIDVANVSGSSGAVSGPVAEQALAFMLACAKRLIPNDGALRDARWVGYWDAGSASVEVAGRTVAVIGLGGLGEAVAARAKAFGTTVLGVRRAPDGRPSAADEVQPADELLAVLARADFVVLCVPSTAQTRGMIGEPALRAMPAHAYLVNVARGDIVDEGSLFRALTEGWIAGFASDVWWDYADALPSGQHFPVPSRLGIHRLPNVLGAGDQGANVLACRDRMIAAGVANVADFAAGRTPARIVDPLRAY